MKPLLWALTLVAILSTLGQFWLAYVLWKTPAEYFNIGLSMYVPTVALDVACIALWKVTQGTNRA